MSDDTSFAYDVFISYSSKDKDWVRGELLKRIEDAGLKVCIDFRDFKPGVSALINMQNGARHSRRLLPVITENWFTSEWTFFEGLMAGRKAPAGLSQRIVPLRLRRCPFPDDADFIAALTHVDFTEDADLDLAWRQLLTALGAAPELPQPKEPEHPSWQLIHPYPMPPNFTGRVSERGTLTRWLNQDKDHPLLVLRALGGFGKSALTWHWLTHDVDAAQWPHVVWWSFYESDASFDQFVVETLDYLFGEKLEADKLSPRAALDALLHAMLQPGTLLVLDGFERVLRVFSGMNAAYQGDEVKTQEHERDCVSPLAEHFLYKLALQPQLRSKVLLTTRLTPRIVEAKGGGLLSGAREMELRQMQPDDAVAFFHAQGIRGTHTEIELACEPYGYHPLSLRLLAGLVLGDFQQPGDIAAARRLDVSGDLIQRQHHVLEQAYDSLTPARRKLLGQIACFRWPVSYDTLKAATVDEPRAKAPSRKGTEKKASAALRIGGLARDLDSDLRDLITRGLLHHDVKEKRFDLHPIVRHYAYDRLSAPDRDATHTRLRDYFAAVPKVDKVKCLEELAPVIELYHHTVRAGKLDEAGTLYRDRLRDALYYQLGAYPLIIELLLPLFPDGENHPPRLKDESDQAWTMNELANSYSLNGQPRRAVPLYERQNTIRQKQGEIGKCNLAISLGNVAFMAQLPIGALRAAESNLRRSFALCREIKDEFWEAVAHLELGRFRAYCSTVAESETSLATALTMFEIREHMQGQGTTWAYRALRELLLLRAAASRQKAQDRSSLLASSSALSPANRALEMADEVARTTYPIERDYVRAHWLLGAAHRVAGEHAEAEHHLHEALERCRRISAVDAEADILIDLARLRAATGKPDEAQRLAEEALLITERSGYVLQGADAHLELAKLALARGDKPTAKTHATEARQLATCDGPPDYTYKVAYDEAGALLEELA